MNGPISRLSTSRWGPYAVAGTVPLADYLRSSRGLSHLYLGQAPPAAR